ncbi:MAG: 16S rRNA (uracil(1498)-N(3))-methyltransferase [Thermodesulfobacteriota bacterium]|nr:16S rRNA (uracil(1498)-N(3))-methyltransferase [Thermodesulfobacteriota bacterium]
MRRFFMDAAVAAGTVCLINGPDASHIKNVLRMKPGDEIWLFNGAGMEFKGVIRAIESEAVAVEITDAFSCVTESPTRLTLAQAFLKDKKMDVLVRQATELGVTRWIPVFTQRTIPRPDAGRVASRMDRWQTIAAESLKQCGRGRLPEIEPPIPFDDLLCRGDDWNLKIIFADATAAGLKETLPPQKFAAGQVLVMIGPEGGFTPDEIDSAIKKGFVAAGLGPRILKADTATVAACAVVQHLLGDM